MGTLAIVLVAGVSIVLLKNQNNTASTPTEVPSFTTVTTSPSTTAQVESQSGMNSFGDQNNIFTFNYPDSYTLDTQDPQHIRIYKRGEMQRPQSEMSDGALLVFEPIDLKGASLESWVDARIEQSTADGTSEITEEKRSITQNGYAGFYYGIRGLGTSQNIILQKDADSNYAVMITYAISDPEQRGYQKEVDAVISSLTLTK